MSDVASYPDNSQDFQKPDHWWKPGQSGNPRGKPKGARNRLSEAFIADLEQDWLEHGIQVIEAVRWERPQDYLKVIASLLPKDVNLNVNQFENLSDEQLEDRIQRMLNDRKRLAAGPVIDGTAAPTEDAPAL